MLFEKETFPIRKAPLRLRERISMFEKQRSFPEKKRCVLKRDRSVSRMQRSVLSMKRCLVGRQVPAPSRQLPSVREIVFLFLAAAASNAAARRSPQEGRSNHAMLPVSGANSPQARGRVAALLCRYFPYRHENALGARCFTGQGPYTSFVLASMNLTPSGPSFVHGRTAKCRIGNSASRLDARIAPSTI